MRNVILLLLFTTLILSCEKEKPLVNDFIDFKISDSLFQTDSSDSSGHTTTVYDNFTEVGINYYLESNNLLEIKFTMAHKPMDLIFNNPCSPNLVMLKDNIFFKFFKIGNYKYEYHLDDMALYEPYILIAMKTEKGWYASYKNSNNSLVIKNFEILKRIESLSVCEKVWRIVRVNGSFDCYLYRRDYDQNLVDSIRLSCSNFVGTIEDW